MSNEGTPTLGKNIAMYRRAEGLSAAALAEKAGEKLTRSIIANLENGRSDDVSLKQLLALANALRVPPVALVADLNRPGDESFYEMPSVVLDLPNRETLEIEEQETPTRNFEFYSWFTGAFNPYDSLASEFSGAPKLFKDMSRSLRWYESAWRYFAGLVSRFLQSPENESSEQDPEYEEELNTRRTECIRAAVDVFEASYQLESVGITHEGIRPAVESLMKRAKILFDYERDSKALNSMPYWLEL